VIAPGQSRDENSPSTGYTDLAMDCVFCKIAAGEIPSTAVYQDELAYAFGDISPKAPVHVLIIPREHIGSLAEAGAEKRALLGHLMGVAGKIAKQKSLAKGYRVVVNTGEDGGQTVEHLHLHLMGGRQMTWPPG
jgi:histidine triad (HIT) family protein